MKKQKILNENWLFNSFFKDGKYLFLQLLRETTQSEGVPNDLFNDPLGLKNQAFYMKRAR